MTISYEGSVPNDSAQAEVLKVARNFAVSKGWQVEDSPTGIAISPHPSSEPITFEFERLHTSGSAKTQFAGASTHWQVVELLRTVQPLFTTLEVDDESEAWDGASRKDVAALFARIQDRIDELRDQPERGMHPLVRTLLISAVLVALLIAGGFAYSWWVGLL